MHIGLVSYEYPPQSGLGGVGTYTFRLAGALGRAGHRVTVLAGPSEGIEQQQPNVRICRIPAYYNPPLPSRGMRWLYWRVLAKLMERANPLVWHWLKWDFASGGALLDLHREAPFDVIEAPEHAANGLIVGRMQRWPTVLRIHGPWDLFFGINRNEGQVMNHLLADLERKSADYAHVITAPSRSMSAFMKRRWQLSAAPVTVPNFMEVPAQAPDLPRADQDPRIVCAGRIERFKGQDVLLRAFNQIAQRHPRARLVLIGPDQWSRVQKFTDLVHRAAPDVDVRDRIELVGARSLEETQAELRRATIAVIPSTGFESFSFSTLEAMAAGRPTIVSRTGAMPELLDYGRCGLIVTPGDASGLAGSIDRLLRDPELRADLAGRAHRRALEVYDTSAVLPQIAQVYEHAQQRFHAPRSRSPQREIVPMSAELQLA